MANMNMEYATGIANRNIKQAAKYQIGKYNMQQEYQIRI